MAAFAWATRRPTPRAERKADAPLAGVLASGGRILQRKCAQCEDQEQGKPMQAKGATGQGSKKVEPGFVKRRQLRVWPPSSTP